MKGETEQDFTKTDTKNELDSGRYSKVYLPLICVFTQIFPVCYTKLTELSQVVVI